MTDDHHEGEPATGIWARTTAPQSAFTSRQVTTGLVVLLVGLVVTLLLPSLLG